MRANLARRQLNFRNLPNDNDRIPVRAPELLFMPESVPRGRSTSGFRSR